MNLWKSFYDNVKDPSWPSCVNESEFANLPTYIQQELIERHYAGPFITLGPNDVYENTRIIEDLCHADNKNELVNDGPLISTKIASDFDVYHHAESMHGGGLTIGQNFPRVIRYLYPNRQFENGLEWCSGPGYIGYRLLSDGICKNLALQEAYPPALVAAGKTKSLVPTRCQGQVNLIHASRIQDVVTDSKFDLIVGNPPFSRTMSHNIVDYKADLPNNFRLHTDFDWKCHREFFRNVKNILADDGVILVTGMTAVSSIYEWLDDIKAGGLQVVRTLQEKRWSEIYYVQLTHR
jgi:hypothetical protein